MINLNPEICQKIKAARQAAKLSQSAVAREIGCLQSALSMFEQGDGTKLNDEVIERLANKFHVELKQQEKGTEQQVVSAAVNTVGLIRPAEPPRGFCPNPKCPSNSPYQVDGRTFMLPDRKMADPVGATFCAMCGEVLEKKCPYCGADLHDGGICSYCGQPYVSVANG